jgi:hypothetical protein
MTNSVFTSGEQLRIGGIEREVRDDDLARPLRADDAGQAFLPHVLGVQRR